MSLKIKSNPDGRQIAPEALAKLRATILDMFASSAYEDVSIRDICAKAKVSPQTVYKYFGNKEVMFYACIEEDLNELHRLCFVETAKYDDLKERLNAFTRTVCDFYFNRPNVARIVFMNIPSRYWVSRREFIRTPVHEAIDMYIREGQIKGEIWPDVSPGVMQNMIMGMLHRLMTYWLENEISSPGQLCEDWRRSLTRLVFIR
ncbi:MAG: TetR/AcrR family transcriptional regulator [Sphingomonadales bacterium]|jgi:AcrR family transcriptional regulator